MTIKLCRGRGSSAALISHGQINSSKQNEGFMSRDSGWPKGVAQAKLRLILKSKPWQNSAPPSSRRDLPAKAARVNYEPRSFGESRRSQKIIVPSQMTEPTSPAVHHQGIWLVVSIRTKAPAASRYDAALQIINGRNRCTSVARIMSKTPCRPYNSDAERIM